MEQSRQTPIGELRFAAPGVLVHRLTEGVLVTEQDAVVVNQATAELAEGKPVVVIVDMRGVGFAGREARDGFSDVPAGVEIGTALLTDRGFSEKLAGLFTKYSEPTRPVEVFHSEANAIAWAESLLSS